MNVQNCNIARVGNCLNVTIFILDCFGDSYSYPGGVMVMVVVKSVPVEKLNKSLTQSFNESRRSRATKKGKIIDYFQLLY